MKSGIYKITNPKGKVYVGQSIDVERRLKKYQRGCDPVQSKLYNSFIKYGTANHTFEVLEYVEEQQLTLAEEHWMVFYNSIKNGLNLKEAGSKGSVHEETKQKISTALRGREITPEWREKISKANKGLKRTQRAKAVMSSKREEYWRELYKEAYNKSDEIKQKYSEGTSMKKLSYLYNIGYDTLKKILSS